MTIRKLVLATAATTLAVSPLAVQAAPVERSTAATAGESQLGGQDMLWWIVALIAIIVGIILVAKNDTPKSP